MVIAGKNTVVILKISVSKVARETQKTEWGTPGTPLGFWNHLRFFFFFKSEKKNTS